MDVAPLAARIQALGLGSLFELRLARSGFTLALDLQVPAQGITALFGPSGSGKTTVLRCVAGLERAGGARIAVAGEAWQDDAAGLFLPPWRRPLGYVFQEASLFDHLDVRGNLRLTNSAQVSSYALQVGGTLEHPGAVLDGVRVAFPDHELNAEATKQLKLLWVSCGDREGRVTWLSTSRTTHSSATTTLSGRATFAPRAAGEPKPIVAKPPNSGVSGAIVARGRATAMARTAS